MGENVEIAWENDITLEIRGEADKHVGDLTLNIPVNKKYEGLTLTVLHYVGGEVEELEGIVKDGVLTVKTKSLSPFAVIVPVEEEIIVPDDNETAPEDSEPAVPEDETGKDYVPETGEHTAIWIAAVLMLAAAAAVLFAVKRARAK